jgi:hypothetical protein
MVPTLSVEPHPLYHCVRTGCGASPSLVWCLYCLWSLTFCIMVPTLSVEPPPLYHGVRTRCGASPSASQHSDAPPTQQSGSASPRCSKYSTNLTCSEHRRSDDGCVTFTPSLCFLDAVLLNSRTTHGSAKLNREGGGCNDKTYD